MAGHSKLGFCWLGKLAETASQRNNRHAIKLGCHVAIPESSDFRFGSFSTKLVGPSYVRYSPDSDRTADITGGPVRADTVEKVENCATPKISQI